MSLPQHLKCPACGANLSGSGRDCEYCGAALSYPPGPGQAYPDSLPADQPKEMTTEEGLSKFGGGLTIIGWIIALISILVMLSNGIFVDAVVYLIGGIIAILAGKALQLDNVH